MFLSHTKTRHSYGFPLYFPQILDEVFKHYIIVSQPQGFTDELFTDVARVYPALSKDCQLYFATKKQ